MSGPTPAQIAAIAAETTAAIRRAQTHQPDESWREWLVDIAPYDRDGVVIERFEVTQRQAVVSALRAQLNPQRSDRSVQAGMFSRLSVDGQVWMTDTPAEVHDLYPADDAMADVRGGSMLIAGLGLGVVLHRALTVRGMHRIDVVERDRRVIDAVGEHYEALAAVQLASLRIHCADIHDWRPPRGSYWDVGFFDIWATINDEDMAEVTRLRKRFRTRLGWFGAWAQDERIAMARRIRSGWAY